MRESAADRSARYVDLTTRSLKRMKLKSLPRSVQEREIEYVLDLAKGYVKDARHYAKTRKPVTSLACVAYAEGLLDALKFLELAEF